MHIIKHKKPYYGQYWWGLVSGDKIEGKSTAQRFGFTDKSQDCLGSQSIFTGISDMDSSTESVIPLEPLKQKEPALEFWTRNFRSKVFETRQFEIEGMEEGAGQFRFESPPDIFNLEQL